MIIQGKLFGEGCEVQVHVSDGFISKIQDDPLKFENATIRNCHIFPPLFDPQINGAMKVSFTDPQGAEAYDQVINEAWRHGVSGLLPTVITTSVNKLRDCLNALTKWRDSNTEVAASVPGFHLEGPGISPIDGFRGAHPVESVRPWGISEYESAQEITGGLVKMVTIAPEIEGNLLLIPQMVRDKVVVALGHTNATMDDLARAMDAGATLFTHWGNGIANKIDRHHNPLWPALADDRLFLSLIADGHHLPDAMLKVAGRCKTPIRTILTADTGPLAGAEPGIYELWNSRVRVWPNGKLTVNETNYLAGSSSWLDTCMMKMNLQVQCNMKECWRMGSTNIRNLLGMEEWGLFSGKKAELTVIKASHELEIIGCFGGGTFVSYSPRMRGRSNSKKDSG